MSFAASNIIDGNVNNNSSSNSNNNSSNAQEYEWTVMNSGVTADLVGIWGSSNTAMWAVGSDAGAGVLIYWDGNNWVNRSSELPASVVPRSIFGTAADNVWIVGNDALIVQYNGSVWQTSNSPVANADFTDIHGSGPENIWAVGNTPTEQIAIRYNGSAWQVSSPAPMGASSLNGVFAAGPDDAWAVGSGDTTQGALLHFNGTTWSNESAGDAVHHDVFGSASDFIFAAGVSQTITNDKVRMWDGTSWEQTVATGLGGTALGLWGTSNTNFWMVDDRGHVYRWVESIETNCHTDGDFFSGDGWCVDDFDVFDQVANPVNAIWGFSDTDIWVAGNNGGVSRRDSGSIQNVP